MRATLLSTLDGDHPARRITSARFATFAPWVAGALTTSVGSLAAIQYAHPVARQVLQTVPGLTSIKPNSSLCLIAVGVALILSRAQKPPWLMMRRLLAWFVVVVGLMSAMEYLLDVDLGIDRWFLPRNAIAPMHGARMGLNTALAFGLLGCSVLAFERTSSEWIGQFCAFSAGVLAVFVLIGYAAEPIASLRIALVGTMSIPTALAVVVSAVGLLCMPTSAGLLDRIELPVRFIFVGLAALIALLCATAWLYFSLVVAATRIAEQAFDSETAPIAAGLDRYIDQAIETLSGARALFAASEEVSRSEWHAFVDAQESISPMSGILAIGFSRWLTASQLEQHEREVQSEGFPNYHVHPAGARNAYSVIEYIEPFRGENLRAFGYDLLSEPVRRNAIEQAIRTRRPTLSGPLTLIQSGAGDTQPGFALVLPVFEAAQKTESGGSLIGFVYASIRLPDLIAEAVSYTVQEQPDIAFEVADSEQPDRVLYRFPSAGSASLHPLYESRSVLRLAQREWILHFSSLPSFELAYRSRAPLVALYVGTLLSITLVAVAMLLLGYRGKSESLAVRTKELGYQLALNRSVTEQMADPVIVVDVSDHVTFMNAAARQQFGYASEELARDSLHERLHRCRADGSAYPAEHCPILKSFKGEAISDFETVFFRKDGAAIDVLISAGPLFIEHQRTGGVLVAHDITSRKRTEDALIKSNQELQRFAYVASHDLQTPLRSIASFTQLLQESLRSGADAQQTHWMDRIVMNARKMEQLVTSVLSYARIESSAAPAARVDLNRSLESALHMLQASIEESAAHIEVERLPIVSGDSMQLMQVFQNLIGNALKYRGERPPVVHVGCETRGAEHFISVRDNGIGIDPEHHTRIFEVFKRLHPERGRQGAGIGLAICRRIVGRHGGSIWVESQPGEGSTFWFTLPVATDAEARDG